MPSVQVKDVPDDVHAVLRIRAAGAGQSLQEYLLKLLSDEARTPTLEEVFARIEARDLPVLGDDTVVDALDAAQAEREEQLDRRR
ncbi:MAG: hypothetical protein QM733_01585 [Ilumatobacteraceae bacterium]